MVEETPSCYSCYVCFESQSEPFALHPLPCSCKGDIVIHLSCLSRVIKRSRICSICKTRYNRAYLPTKDGKELIVKRTRQGDVIEYTVDDIGDMHGMYLLKDRSGKTILSQTYQHGKRNGPSIEYYPSGHMKSWCHCVQNRIDGEYREWFEDGTPKELSYYYQGLKDGQSIIWKRQRDSLVHYVDYYSNGIKCNYSCLEASA
jgi:hypothetical protein